MEAEQLRRLKRLNRLLGQERGAAPGRALSVPGDQPEMMFRLVGDVAAPTALLRVPVTVTCRVLKFSTQAFYKWLANPICQRDWDDAHLINAVMDLHGDDPEFGYRLLTDELRINGFSVSENRGVAVVLSAADLQRAQPKAWSQPQAPSLRARRPARPGLHRRDREHQVADRHRRAPTGEGKHSVD